MLYDEIYKVDSKGKVRVWYIEQDGDQYRTWDGTQIGKVKCSEWRIAIPTNVGRSNERMGYDQAKFEIEATYKEKLDKDYHTSVAAAQAGGAHIFEPMLAEKYKSFQPGYAQPKLDGMRCIAKADGLWSRTGKAIRAVPHIWDAIAHLFANDPYLILDGELYNHDLKDDFNTIMSICKKQDPTAEQLKISAEFAQYHVYDMPSHGGVFSERFLELVNILPNHLSLNPVETVHVTEVERFDACHGIWLECGFEGSMWRSNTTYENKRTKALQKRKEFIDAEFELVSIEEGQGNWAGVAKRVICKLPDGRTFGAGIKGTKERAKDLLHEEHKIVTIKYFQLTPDGIPRFGIATQFHGDKREF